MVDDESAVLPAPAAFGPADPDDSLSVFESDDPSEARPSRPFSGDDRDKVHAIYLDIYKVFPVTVVTAFQGHREWHVARRHSFTSTTTHALIKAMLRHYGDLEFDYVRIVCEYMCPNYIYFSKMASPISSI